MNEASETAATWRRKRSALGKGARSIRWLYSSINVLTNGDDLGAMPLVSRRHTVSQYRGSPYHSVVVLQDGYSYEEPRPSLLDTSSRLTLLRTLM